MAPLEPSVVSKSNIYPLTILSSHALLVAGLTSHILLTIRRASRSIPPASATRVQQSVRRKHAAIFSTIALLSIASVTTFAVAWRLHSYLHWAESGNHDSPGGLWTGWYGTGDEGVGRWRLGDWWRDIDLFEDQDAKVLAAPESFLYQFQHFCGITATALFYGIEGRRRNLSLATIASFVVLSVVGSLGLALSLFFVLLLYTPFTQHDDDSYRYDALFTPKAAVLYLPVLGPIVLQYLLPIFLARRTNLILFRLVYVAIPLFLAFAPQIVPVRWGHRYASKAAAHRSYVRAFYIIGVASFVLYLIQWGTMVFTNMDPPNPHKVYAIFMNALGKQQDTPNRFLGSLYNTFARLKVVSMHPAISVTSVDVAITAYSLLVWAFIRRLDVSDVLENSIYSFMGPPKEKHVAFKKEVEEVTPEMEEDHAVLTPRKRGRPKKTATTSAANHSPPPASPYPYTSGPRRSTRRTNGRPHVESDAEDSTYEPSIQTVNDVNQIETDGASEEGDLLEGGEATALALFLSFIGGLGAVAASVLGAEVTGSA